MGQGQRITFEKKVFNKPQYIKIIDNQFKELGISSIQEDISNTLSIEEFFELYNNLFFDIPAEGETNSHRFLVETSGEFINFEDKSEEIEALQQEIARLRQENLQLRLENVELTTGEKQPTIQTGEENDIEQSTNIIDNITQELEDI